MRSLRGAFVSYFASAVRWIGRAQFRYPLLQRAVSAVVPLLTKGDRVIRVGVGAGLRFNASGGNLGYALGTSEPEEQAALRRFVSPGAVVYDLGANIGFFAVLAGRFTGPMGSVFAFEPYPDSASRARANAALNGFGHVTVIEAAVGASSRSVAFEVREMSAKHRVAAAPTAGSLIVDQVAIDEWRASTGAPAPDVVLIDVEGAEIDALRGMRETLRKHQPVVMCEVHWLGSAVSEFFEEELAPLGYELRSLEGPVPTGICRWHAILEPKGATSS